MAATSNLDTTEGGLRKYEDSTEYEKDREAFFLHFAAASTVDEFQKELIAMEGPPMDDVSERTSVLSTKNKPTPKVEDYKLDSQDPFAPQNMIFLTKEASLFISKLTETLEKTAELNRHCLEENQKVSTASNQKLLALADCNREKACYSYLLSEISRHLESVQYALDLGLNETISFLETVITCRDDVFLHLSDTVGKRICDDLKEALAAFKDAKDQWKNLHKDTVKTMRAVRTTEKKLGRLAEQHLLPAGEFAGLCEKMTLSALEDLNKIVSVREMLQSANNILLPRCNNLPKHFKRWCTTRRADACLSYQERKIHNFLEHYSPLTFQAHKTKLENMDTEETPNPDAKQPSSETEEKFYFTDSYGHCKPYVIDF